MQSLTVVALMAGAFISSAASAGQFFPSSGEVVPYQYIVVLDHDPGDALQTLRPEIASLLRTHRVPVTAVWNSALNGFTMLADDETAQKASKLVGVAFVEPDIRGHAAATQTNPPPALDVIDQRSLTADGTYAYNYTAPAVHAYVLDSGIRTTHVEFGGRATLDANFANDGQTADLHNHGTGVASVIGGASIGVAKQIRLHSVRVIDSGGGVAASEVISGLNWVSQNGLHPGIVNISLQLDTVSNSVDIAVNGVIAQGFFVSVAAGNRAGLTNVDGFSDSCTITPARVPDAFTVAAATTWSYRGTCVDVFAPGSTLILASSVNDTAVRSDIGTSFAAPHAAGAAALILQQFPNLTPRQISWELIARSSKNLLAESSTWHLYGSPNRWLYTLSLNYTTVPSMPSLLTLESCFAPHYTVEWTGGAVNSTNIPTYYELQTSTNTTFSPATSTYADGSVATGIARITSPSQIYVRARTCNSLGCGSFRTNVANLPCN